MKPDKASRDSAHNTPAVGQRQSNVDRNIRRETRESDKLLKMSRSRDDRLVNGDAGDSKGGENSVHRPGNAQRPFRWPHRDRWTGMSKTMLDKFRVEQRLQMLELQEKKNLERTKSRQEGQEVVDRDKKMMDEERKNTEKKRQCLKKIERTNRDLAERQRDEQRAAKARIYDKDAISDDFFNQFNYEQGAWADEQGFEG